MYSLGTYVRDSDMVLCSSISRTSLRASSTGRTSDRKTRPNVPSTRSVSLASRLRRTLMPGFHATGEGPTRSGSRATAHGARGDGDHGGGERPRDEPPRRIEDERLRQRLRRGGE